MLARKTRKQLQRPILSTGRKASKQQSVGSYDTRCDGTDGTPKSHLQPEGALSRRFVSLRERIECYVDACPEAISGEQGHNTTFKVAIALSL